MIHRRILIGIAILFFSGFIFLVGKESATRRSLLVPAGERAFSEQTNLPSLIPTPTVTLIPTPTPTPTPKPLTFQELNSRYGPCVFLPVLMYHHVEQVEPGKKVGSLTVTADFFRSQMHYLRDRGYHPIAPAQLIAFFDSGTPLPAKPVLITFDDGYADTYTVAFPILKELGFPALVFLPTGLMENPGYLSWSQIAEMVNGGISFGNHTWSHYSAGGASERVEKEIGLADRQLAEKGLNTPKVLAYPYGSYNSGAEKFLQILGYSIAFTTHSGSTLCLKKRLELPRIRIGNAPLPAYGF